MDMNLIMDPLVEIVQVGIDIHPPLTTVHSHIGDC